MDFTAIAKIVYTAVEGVLDENVETYGYELGQRLADGVADTETEWDDELAEKLFLAIDAIKDGFDAFNAE